MFWVELCRETGEEHFIEEKPGDVLTIEESAAYLKRTESTHFKLVREAKIPSQKIGSHWRFRKGATDHWLEETRANEPGSGEDR